MDFLLHTLCRNTDVNQFKTLYEPQIECKCLNDHLPDNWISSKDGYNISPIHRQEIVTWFLETLVLNDCELATFTQTMLLFDKVCKFVSFEKADIQPILITCFGIILKHVDVNGSSISYNRFSQIIDRVIPYKSLCILESLILKMFSWNLSTVISDPLTSFYPILIKYCGDESENYVKSIVFHICKYIALNSSLNYASIEGLVMWVIKETQNRM